MHSKPISKFDTKQLRSIVYGYLCHEAVQATIRGEWGVPLATADDLQLWIHHNIDNLMRAVWELDRKVLRDLAEQARKAGYKLPNKPQRMRAEPGELFLAVRARLRPGISERKACNEEAEAQGATLQKELEVWWNEYGRSKKRIKEILDSLNLDIEMIIFSAPKKLLPAN